MTPRIRRHALPFVAAILFVLLPLSLSAQSWQWVRHGRGNDHEAATRVTADSAGNSYVMGRFAGTLSFGTTLLSGIGLWDTFIAKFDQLGTLQWAIAVTGPGNDYPGDLVVDRAGNVYVTGSFSGSAIVGGRPVAPRGAGDVYLAKLTPLGAVEWVAVGGGTGDDGGAGLGIDQAGENIIIAGWFSGNASFLTENLASAGGTDVFVACYSPAGGLRWVRRGGGPRNDMVAGMGVDNFGSAFVTGTFADSASFAQYAVAEPASDSGAVFVAKYDFAGIPRWAVSVGRFPQRFGPIAVAVDPEGNSFITGSFADSLKLGATMLRSAGRHDAFLARVNPFGGIRWAVSLGDTLNDFGLGVGADASGNPYLTGALDNTGTTTLDTLHHERMFLARFTANGALAWIDTSDGGRIERGYDVGVDRIGNEIVGGAFLDTLVLGDVSVVSTGFLSDAFVAKIGPDATIATTVGDTVVCAGGTLPISYATGGSFFGGNEFIAQLSDSTGSFARPTVIGTRVSANAGTIIATIPDWLPGGTRYRVRVIGTNPSVEGSDNGRDLDVVPLPHPTITEAIDDTLCEGESVTLDAPAGFAAYRWSTGALSRSITVATAGSYYVTVTTTTGCEGRSDTARIVVFAAPPKPVITQVGSLLRTAAGTRQQWYRNGVAIPGADRERYTPSEPGTYTVTVFNEAGCSASSDPFEFTTTGVREEIADAGIVIERRTADVLSITGGCGLGATLVDMSGRVVATTSGDGRIEIGLDGMPSGAYLLRVSGCGGVEVVRKVMR